MVSYEEQIKRIHNVFPEFSTDTVFSILENIEIFEQVMGSHRRQWVKTMIDFKKTITNLHKEFPDFDLDTLMKIIDAIQETPTLTNYPNGIRDPFDRTVTCTYIK